MRGGDSSGLKAYNERLIVSALLREGPLSKAEIARETGLSGQAAAVIVNRLLGEGLLVKREKIRGQIGQPSTPIAPNPEGAFSLGLKIGRRSIEAILVNLLGETIGTRRESYAAPFPERTVEAAVGHARDLLAELVPVARERVVGLGIAMPGELQAWSVELGLAPGALDGWRDADVVGALEAATGLEAVLFNDATAACAAEMIAGEAIRVRSALYIYLGTFIGGGVVIDGKLYRGEQLNAGAIGSMPSGLGRPGDRPGQLIHSASVIQLEQALEARGMGSRGGFATGPSAEAVFEAWAERAIDDLARAVVSALGVIDFQAVVVDGLLPPAWRARMVERLEAALGRFNRSGLSPAAIAIGTIGPMARVLGAALLPLEMRFSPDTDLLVRSGAGRAPARGAADEPEEIRPSA